MKIKKDKYKAAGLAAGGFICLAGFHKFYLGNPVMGVVYFITCGFFFLGTIIDVCVLLTMDDADFDMKYNRSFVVENMPELQSEAKSSPQSNDLYNQIQKLGQLKEQGLLSEEEFQAQKTKLLNS